MAYLASQRIQVTPQTHDAFGHLSVSEPDTLFASSLQQDAQPQFWDDQQRSGTATSTYNSNQASVTLAVGAGVAGYRCRQTFRRIGYQPGKGQNIKLTGILGTPATGVTRRIGSFDDNNGYFFESNATDVRLVLRTNTSGTPSDANFKTSANWNIDKLDGSGPSGVTVDWSKVHIFGVKYQWLGVGSVWFYVVVNGAVCPVHRFDCANLQTLVYLSTPSLPLRYEINATAANAGAALTCICASVESDGGREDTGIVRSATRGLTVLTTNKDTNLYPLVAIRLRSGYYERQVKAVASSVFCNTATTSYRWAVLLNPTVVGTALSFSALESAVSGVEVAIPTNATTVTGGRELDADYASTGGKTSSNLNSAGALTYWLGATSAWTGSTGTADVLVVAVQNFSSAANVDYYGGILFSEG